MDKFYQILKNNMLFTNVNEDDFTAMLSCLNATSKKYIKGEYIFIAGNKFSNMGLVLSGAVMIIQEDEKGNQNIMAEIKAGDIFGEVFACAGIEISPVTVQCITDCEVLFIDYNKIINVCSNSCYFHNKLIENMLKMISQKTLILNKKIDILSQRSIKEKIVAFLKWQSNDKKEFEIPFSRQEMAEYLCVDRSALSNELSKMQKEKLLNYNKNYFRLNF